MADQDLTPEQIAELQTKASRVDDLEKFKADSEPKLKELETLEKEKPNWQKTRQTIDALKAIAKDKGVEVDDDGKVITSHQTVDVEKIKQESAATMRKEMLDARVEEVLGEYEEADAKMVRHYYDKLTAGEDVNLKNVKSFILQAEKAAGINSSNSRANDIINFNGGAGPRQAEAGKLDDNQAKNLGTNMGLGFASKKDGK